MSRLRGWRRSILLAILVLVCVLPVIWVVLASFKIVPRNDMTPPIWAVPPSLEDYEEVSVTQPLFTQEMVTSFLLSMSATLLTIGTAFLAAYALARSRFRRRTLVLQMFLILAGLPVIAYVIPLSEILRFLGLHDTFVGLLLAETAVHAPLAVFVLHGYIVQIPAEYEDAALLDGAALTQILWRVIIPAALPGLMATGLVVFVLAWNQFFIPVILTAVHIRVVSVMMRDFFTQERDLDWSQAAAALVVSLLPVLVVVAAAHRMLEHFQLDIPSGEV
jgi:ABC-type glycerol-3-phosphate transport system permease component